MKLAALNQFERILATLFRSPSQRGSFSLANPADYIDPVSHRDEDIARSLNASFLILLAGSLHPMFEKAKRFVNEMRQELHWAEIAAFYWDAADEIRHEISEVCLNDPDFAERHQKSWS